MPIRAKVTRPPTSPSRLHTEWPGLSLPHFNLLCGPTPVRPVPELGPNVWLKDDSRSGKLYGGNKVRKLEWSLAEAAALNRNVVITVGATGTNHGRATALYARELGMRSVVVLVDQPPNNELEANLSAMRAAGARLVFAHSTQRALATVPWLILRHMGARAPWILPVGGSNAAGVLGFVQAAYELADQINAGELPQPAEIVIAVGSGGSAAGLLLGLRLAGLDSIVRGVLVSDHGRITERKVVSMAQRSLKLLQRRGVDAPTVALDGFVLDRSELGDGYGHATASGSAAIARFAAAEIALEQVYTAKAAAALLARPEHATTVLFWNTFSAPEGAK